MPDTTRSDLASGTSELDDATYSGLAGFRFAIRQFMSFSDTISSVAGITSQQYQVMLAIRASSRRVSSVKHIAEQMLLRPNAAVQIVDRMERARLVTRRRSPTDGRVVLISLTSRGTKLLKQLAASHLAELRRHHALLEASLALLREINS